MDIEKISKISKEKRNRMISAMQERYRLMQKGYEMDPISKVGYCKYEKCPYKEGSS